MDSAITMRNSESDPEKITISCFRNEIPTFIETELVQLYNTLHSSLPFFKVFRTTDKVSSYVVWRDNRPITILLFRYGNGKIDVLNEMIELDQEEIHRFSRYVFLNFSEVNIISFKAVSANIHKFPFPLQKNNAKDTYVITLPETPEKYLASLGKNIRNTIKCQLRKIVRDYPSFTSRFYVGEEINEQHIRELIKLSESRISIKEADFTHDEKRIMLLAKMCGFVHVLLIEGRVCGGTVNYCIGSNYFNELSARDLSYQAYGIGKLSLYLTICETIARSGKKYYLGGGRFEYKNKMLAVKQDMDRLEIYRSYGKLALHFDNVAHTAIEAYVRRLKVWLRQHDKYFFSRFIFSSFYFFKKLRAHPVRMWAGIVEDRLRR